MEEQPGVNDWEKLVRDKIPEIAMRDGRTIETRTVTGREFETMLIRKLQEEVAEFVANRNVEEVADIEEVLRAYTEYKEIGWDAVEALRRKKNEERGSFKRKIILSKVKQ